MPDAATFRNQFPVLERCAYLNAGTEGPVPRAAADAVRERVELDLRHGRTGRPYYEAVTELSEKARAGYAQVLGADPTEVALTGSTTDGINTVLSGLRLVAGEQVLTSDEEHPGVLAPLRLAAIRHGVKVKVVPFAELAGEVRPSTRLVACSHVSWVSGQVADVEALRATGAPILLDAAQALGAIPVDVHALGVDFYAGSGQKWLCGPEGSGALYVRSDRLDELEPPWPSFATLEDSNDGLRSGLAEHTCRLDVGFPPAVRSAWAVASLETFGAAGWAWVHERAASLAEQLAAQLRERGLEVQPRGRSTLVSWRSPVDDAAGDVMRLAQAGIVVRSIPSANLVRASVGAWSDEPELERLVALAAA